MESLASTLVCFAVNEEAACFKRLIGEASAGIRILITGMGQKRAEQSVQAALAAHPTKLVISSGFAGGLRTDLDTGMVLFAADETTGLEQPLIQAGAQPGRFHCATRVATTAEQKSRLREVTGADAVEMESQAICRLCAQHGVPAITIRVILDVAGQDLPLDFNRILTPDQRIDGLKLAGALLRSPGKIPALLKLRAQTQNAAKRLAKVLVASLSHQTGNNLRQA
jgi:adenosylhomocysteine nucleosidase